MKDIDEIRRDNLRLLEQEFGGPSETANIVGMSPAQFINLRDGARDSRTGKARGMRKGTARRIETATKKPEGWLDKDHSGVPEIYDNDLPLMLRLYLAAPEEKRAVVDFLLNARCVHGWADADARAYMAALEMKASQWIKNKSGDETDAVSA